MQQSFLEKLIFFNNQGSWSALDENINASVLVLVWQNLCENNFQVLMSSLLEVRLKSMFQLMSFAG